MVVFTCNHCGESLHKPKVEKHYNTVCRRPKFVSCVDCLKDFRNEEYSIHIKCMTEQERYSAKGAFPQGIQAKGDIKQESWTDMIKSATSDFVISQPNQKRVIEIILNSTNVPRKKQKFLNFVKSATSNRVPIVDIEKVWMILENYKEKQEKPKVKESKPLTNENSDQDLTENNTDIENWNSLKDILKSIKFLNKNHKKIVAFIKTLDQVPQIKKKFIKILKRSNQNFDPEDIKAVWEIIISSLHTKSDENEKQVNVATNEKLSNSQTINEMDAEKQDCDKSENTLEKIVYENDTDFSFNNWSQLVKSALKTVTPRNKSQKKIIKIIKRSATNIPSKKKKFTKFIKNLLDDADTEDIDCIWSILKDIDATENALVNNFKLTETPKQLNTEDEELLDQESTKSKKRKLNDNESKQNKKRKNKNHENSIL